jgi:membrane protease subunit HflC
VRPRLRHLLLGLALLLVAVSGSTLYIVPQAQQALLVRLGRPLGVESEPGLYAKWPFIDTVYLYDTRLLSLQPPTEQTILGDQKRLQVDTFTEFRISDPLRFNQTVFSLEQARQQLTQIVASLLRRRLGQVSLPSLLSPERDAIITDIRKAVTEAARPLGIEVADVSILRVDLPPETSQAIYDRMTSERQREAKELRAQGFEWAQEIDARADRERTELLAEAQLKARITRAAGDAEASRILAEAFGRQPEFFAFYRATQTYGHALADSAPTLLLSPDAELLRYFNTGVPGAPKP